MISQKHLEFPTNLFFTNERVDDRVSVLLKVAQVLSKSYNDLADSLTLSLDFTEFDTDNVVEGSTNLFFTNDRARACRICNRHRRRW